MSVDGEAVFPDGLRPESWAELARAHGGTVDAKRRKIRAVHVRHGTWRLKLDTQSDGETESTRWTALVEPRAGARLSIQRLNPATRLLRRLGLRDVTVPDPRIDRDFLVRTDRPSVIGSLVLDRAFAEALLALPKGRLELKPVRKLWRATGTWRLMWIAAGNVRDGAVLEAALRLVRVTLDALVRLGIARGPAPAGDDA